MGQEKNFEGINALEKEIAKGGGDIIKLKRTRNSMLNISVLVPPEILGYIFNLVVVLSRCHSKHQGTDFAGSEKGSYNFLLVCHHWLEVAYSTPELWIFWGNSLEDWEKRYFRAESAPVDLVLYGRGGCPDALSDPLKNNLLRRTAQDKIRKIHLDSNNLDLLTSIISSLTPSGEGARERCLESIILRKMGELPDLSNFFARSRFPKLQRLHLIGSTNTPPWNHLPSQTTCLTSLSLRLTRSSRAPTTSQLLPILLSNPNLLELTLSDAALPDDIDESEIRVPLHRLKTMNLSGEFSRVFRLMQRLELTAALNHTELSFYDYPAGTHISQTLGPYMQNHLRRDPRFQERLNVTCLCGYISVFPDRRLQQPFWLEWTSPPPRFTISIIHSLNSALKRLTLDLMTFVSPEHVVYLEMEHSLGVREELFIEMPNVEMLWLRDVWLSNGFLQPDKTGPHANAKLLPSLRSLHLENVMADAGWKPLVDYLVHQTSNHQAISLEVLGRCSRVPPKVVKEVEALVEKFLRERILRGDFSDDDDD